MIYLVAALCVFNVIMWIIFGIRFHKIFSPDGMIEKARDGMNRLLRSMQKNTIDNVNLVNETIQKLEQSKIAAERKIDEINRKLELLNAEAGMVQFRESVKKSFIDPNAVYAVNKPVQKDLFEKPDEIHVTDNGASYKEVPMLDARVLEEKPAFEEKTVMEEIPVKVIPKVGPKKSVDEQVMNLFRNGHKVSDIASELNLSETEVQFVIDLN